MCHRYRISVVTVVCVVVNMVQCCAADVLLRDDFDSYRAKTWGSRDSQTIIQGEGTIINRPPQGQRYLASTKKYGPGALELRFKLNALSTDSTIFYYIGLQSITPWVHDLCWMTVQDSVLNVSIRKDGGPSVHTSVANVQENRWYTLKIVRTPQQVQFILDGNVIFENTDAEMIPTARLPIFLSANTTTDAADAKKAELELDWLEVTGDSPAPRSSKPRSQSQKEQPVFNQQIGGPDGPRVQAQDNIICLENEHYLCELSLENGLHWERLYNKVTDEDYLAEEDCSPIFILQRKKHRVDSRDFLATTLELTESAGGQRMQLRLNHARLKLDCIVETLLDESDQMGWSLTIENQSRRDTTIQAVFPVISQLNIGNLIEDNSYFFPWRSGVVGSVDCDLTYEYGAMAWMQVISIFSEQLESGFYTYPLDAHGQFKGLIFRKSSTVGDDLVQHKELTASYERPNDVFEFDEGVGLAYYYLPQKIAGQGRLELPQTAVCIYRGGWKRALKSYSTWAHTWYKDLDRPRWFKDCFGYLPRHKSAYYSEEERRYVSTRIFKGAEDIVQWAHWWDYEEDRDLPRTILMGREQPGDFDYNEHRGGLEAFREEVCKNQQQGVRFTVYIDHRFCCNETKIGTERGAEWAAIYEPGGDYAGYGGPDDQYVTCYHEANAWADYLADTCGRIVRDTGMDGIYLDELVLPFACYNRRHNHLRQHDSIIHLPNFIANIKNARTAMRRENPEAILMTEHAGSDYFTQFVDGSWTQTFYKGAFPFAEKHFDRHSLNYFRFCFPEFKLATWGTSNDGPRRCFFNGIGIDWGVGSVDYLRKTGTLLRENGDAIATLAPEPLVETLVDNVLANKFPIEGKILYTIYNKNDHEISDELLEVTPSDEHHYVELFHDNEVPFRNELFRIKDILKPTIAAQEVVCVAILPRIIAVEKQDARISITLTKEVANARLLAFVNEDNSHLNDNDGQLLDLQYEAPTVLDLATLSGPVNKIILKLFQGDYLLDEAILTMD